MRAKDFYHPRRWYVHIASTFLPVHIIGAYWGEAQRKQNGYLCLPIALIPNLLEEHKAYFSTCDL